MQNDVTQKIAATLTGYEGAVAEAEGESSPGASHPRTYYRLRHLPAGHGGETQESNEEFFGREQKGLFRKALELDPQSDALGRCFVDVQFYLIDLGLAPSVEEALSKMMEAGEKAVKLDPNDGKTHYALGLAYTYHGKPEQALAEFDRAEIFPCSSQLLESLPSLGELGDRQ